MLRVALLCTDEAPGLLDLLAEPASRRRWKLILCLGAGERIPLADELEARGVSRIARPIESFFRHRGTRPGDVETHRDFDRETAQLLRAFGIDVALLAGYGHPVTEPLLEELPERLLAIHPADLSRRGTEGRPRYLGGDPVLEALEGGERETRATVHLVTGGGLPGRPLLRSAAFPVAPLVERARAWGHRAMLEAYAAAHRQWMMGVASGPLFARALDRWPPERMGSRPGQQLPELDAGGRVRGGAGGSQGGSRRTLSGAAVEALGGWRKVVSRRLAFRGS